MRLQRKGNLLGQRRDCNCPGGRIHSQGLGALEESAGDRGSSLLGDVWGTALAFAANQALPASV